MTADFADLLISLLKRKPAIAGGNRIGNILRFQAADLVGLLQRLFRTRRARSDLDNLCGYNILAILQNHYFGRSRADINAQCIHYFTSSL